MMTWRERLAIVAPMVVALAAYIAAVVLVLAPGVAEKVGLSCPEAPSMEQWYCLARYEQGFFIVFALLVIAAAATIYMLNRLG